MRRRPINFSKAKHKVSDICVRGYYFVVVELFPKVFVVFLMALPTTYSTKNICALL